MSLNVRSLTCHIKRNYRALLLFRRNFLYERSPPIRHYQRKMPRSFEHMLGLHRVRQKIKEKSTKYIVNTPVSLQVSVSAPDGTRCRLNSRMFNGFNTCRFWAAGPTARRDASTCRRATPRISSTVAKERRD